MNPNRLVLLFFAIFAIFGALRSILGVLVDALWFGEIGQSEVFWTILRSKLFLGAMGFVIAFAYFGGNLLYANRRSPLRQFPGFGDLARALPTQGRLTVLMAVAAVAASLFLGAAAATGWLPYLTFRYQVPFGVNDPIFGRDVAFHVFSMPFLEFARSWMLSLFGLTLASCTAVYLLKGGLFLEGRLMLRPARHLVLLVAVFGIALAFHFWLAGFGLLLSGRGVTHGASYTDVHAQLPAYRILLGASLMASAVIVAGAFRRNLTLLASGPVLLVLAAIVGSVAYPWILQKMVVEPNELEKETPYIQHGIRFTRLAYDLDEIRTESFSADEHLDASDLALNESTLRNIRLWDWRPLRSTYSQIQEIRLYYKFVDVDVDRYWIDGKYRQVMLSAREMSPGEIPADARTWVNLHLKYTHGYGLCLSPVDRVTPEGLPDLLIRDIPPVSTTDLTVSRPAIYYGEENLDYALVGTSTDEFDYPIGESNAATRYSGAGGIPIGSFWRRLLFAGYLADTKLLLTGYLTPESRILLHRRIQDRLPKLAPFLRFDRDPYLVIMDDGTLSWIQDGYTISDRFPYSEPFGSINYIRNSVKAVVEAYDGTTRLYAVDPEDPVLQTYRRAFPTLFADESGMPQSIRDHLRYPEDCFAVQAAMYAKYHMTDVEMFYNREDLWEFATETYGGREAAVEPYYVVMRLPGEEREEMILMVPFTPSNKDNMIAWLSARCDGERAGERLVFNFPKQSLVYGPRQIEARIDQDPIISQELTLWGQGNSQVIRGNLLVIPIERGVLYVEPLYLQAEQGELPELKRVILSNGDDIVMEQSLDRALAALAGGTARQWRELSEGVGAGGFTGVDGLPLEDGVQAADRSGPAADGSMDPSGRATDASGRATDASGRASDTSGRASDRSVRATRSDGVRTDADDAERLAAARAAFLEGQRALRAGDWDAYGEAQRRLARILEEQR